MIFEQKLYLELDFIFLLDNVNKLKNYNQDILENINDKVLTWSEFNVRAYEDIPIEETDNDSLTAQLKLGNDTIEEVYNEEVKPV